MHETFSEKVVGKVCGSPWEIKFYKEEAKNAKYYIGQNKRIIQAFRKKYPNDWKKRIAGFKHDMEFFNEQKKDSEKKIKRWEAIQKAQRKLRRMI